MNACRSMDPLGQIPATGRGDGGDLLDLPTAVLSPAAPRAEGLSSGPQPVQHLSIQTNAYVGIKASLKLPADLASRGFRRPSVILDASVAASPSSEACLRTWDDQGLRFVKVYHSCATKEPDYDYLDEVTAEFRSIDTDVVVGIGGGSAMDLAKGVALLLRNPGRGIDYRGMDKVRRPGVAVVLLPTTAGSGSEATATASFIDRKTKSKLGINGRYVECLFSILDPILLTSCPASVTIGSGLDALVHAIEAVTATTANVVSILFGIEAVKWLFASLPDAVAEPGNLHARAATLLGSHYAGMAMRNAGGGPASGISYPLGAYYEVPHGFAGGIFLPHVVQFNVRQGYVTGYARIYERLDGTMGSPRTTWKPRLFPRPEPRDPSPRNPERQRGTGRGGTVANPKGMVGGHGRTAVGRGSRLDDAAKAAAFQEALWELYRRLNAPTTLRRWGVDREAIALLTDLTMAQRTTNLQLNPVPFGRDEVVALLERVIE